MRVTLLLLLAMRLYIPTAYAASYPNPSRDSTERVHLQLSEAVAATGQQLWFQGVLLGDQPQSKVLYVEVLNQQRAVLQGIYPIKDGVAHGHFDLPDTLSGGWYQVRAYTQWMRNFSTAAFGQRPLWVIDPAAASSGGLTDSSLNTVSTERASVRPVKIDLAKRSYRPRETVSLRLRTPTAGDSARVSVSVRKVTPFSGPLPLVTAVATPDGADADKRYPIEDESLTVSGQLKGMSLKAKDRMVVLSVPGQVPYFDYDFVRRDQRFQVPVAERAQGELTVVLQPNDPSIEATWVLDEKFVSENTYLPSANPTMTPADRQALQQAYARRASIDAQYDWSAEVDTAAVLSKTTTPFYGVPNSTVHLEDYTTLPTFKEVARELLFGVRLNEKGLRVVDVSAREFLEGPSVFIDGVLIHNVPYLIDLSPKKLDRIDIVNRLTYYGEYRMNGTMAIYTKSGAGYQEGLSPSAWQGKITLYSPYQPFVAPKLTDHEPDLRTLLHWQPDVRLSDKEREITYRNADELGTFEVVVEGTTADGQPLYGRETYTVDFNSVE